MSRLEGLFRSGRYPCPRDPCSGEMTRVGEWSHDARRTGHAPFRCGTCGYREVLVVPHFSEEEELALHTQHPTYAGRARCPRCGEAMRPRPLPRAGGRAVRLLCERCGGARDVYLAAGAAPRPRGRRGRVLVVDRDVGRGMELKATIEREAGAVEVAGDEAAALELLEREPWHALIVTDDGALNAELLLARRRNPGPRPVVLLLVPEPDVPDAGLPADVFRLPHPCDPALLSWFVAFVLAEGAGSPA